MNDLSPESRALLGALRGRESPEEGPSERDRARLRASLALSLGLAAFASTSSSVAAANAAQAAASTAGAAAGSASPSAATIPSTAANLAASSAAAGLGVGRIVLCLLIGAAVGGTLLVATAPFRAPIAAPIATGALTTRAPRAKTAEESAERSGAADLQARSPFDSLPTVGPELISKPESAENVRESSSNRPAPQGSAQAPRGRDTEPDRAPIAPIARSQNTSERPVEGSASVGAFPVEGAAGAASTLAEEVSLLRSAEEKIRNGDPATALDILRSHEQRFLHGSLEIERRAARIVALCQASRGDEGRLEAAAFARDYPDSPLLDRLTLACGK